MPGGIPNKQRVTVATSEPWIDRTFHKDTRLRSTERYWQPVAAIQDLTSSVTTTILPPQQISNNHCALPSSAPSSSTTIFILPDALTWRKYLRLIRSLIDLGNQPKLSVRFQWILTESAVEALDHRHQSLGEAAAPQERTLLQRLLMPTSSVNNPNRATIRAWPDLSVRTNPGEDEFDMLHYTDLPIVERSRHALVRASVQLLSLLAAGPATVGRVSSLSCWLVMDEDPAGTLPLDSYDYGNDLQDQALLQDRKYVSMEDIIANMAHDWQLSTDEVERLRQVKLHCEDEYQRRNHPESSCTTTDTVTILSPDEIHQQWQEGRLLRGRLTVTRDNVREAFVTSSANNTTFFIHHDHWNHAFHQDRVWIEPLPESQWGRPVGKRRLVHTSQDQEDVDENNDNAWDNVPPVPSGRVVAVDQPSRRVFVATLLSENTDGSGTTAVLVVPMDVRIPKIRLRTPRSGQQHWKGMRLRVEIVDWEPDSHYPNGRCQQILGPIGDLETEIQALLIENQVQLDPFSTEALACLPVQGNRWRVSDQEIQKRRDLRSSRRIFSVDPPGCQDIDDTMHAQVLPNGDVEVGVHIADVTHFVKHNSKLDLEAQVRGTTFYLVDRRFDMLPALLSSDLCSLHGGIDRLAVSVIWILSPDLGTVKSSWFGRTVIHNCAAMTYDQADNILQNKAPDEAGAPLPPPLTAGSPVDPRLIGALKQDLSILTKLARKLRRDREEVGGAVDLSSCESGNELKFTLDKNGNPTKVVPKQDKEIHHTIAEMMIMANTHVATRIFDFFPDSALLRVHRSVEDSRFGELREVLEAAGVSLEGNDSASLARSLKDAQTKHRSRNSPFQSLLLSVATRAMTEAQYICTGDREKGLDLSHYGLGLKKYTHFTSPIRRYADVVVHKQLLASLELEKSPHEKAATNTQVELEPLASIPESTVVSILSGEGLENKRVDEDFDSADEFIEALTEGASEVVLRSDSRREPCLVDEPLLETTAAIEPIRPYVQAQVSTICEGLNLHNRLAKQSSYECQGLFLSLFFKQHADDTTAVVTSLRENGFWCYVPKYDIRGPVYIRDTNGDVQIDPLLIGLPLNAGVAPTMGFSRSGSCRRFPDGKCQLYDEPDARLEVQVAEATKRFVVRLFDVVHIEMTCKDWDVRARIPSPRFQLLANRGTSGGTAEASDDRVGITSKSIARDAFLSASVQKEKEHPNPRTIFDVISAIPIRPVLSDVSIRSVRRRNDDKQQPIIRSETMKGRVVWGDFRNPDTRSATQAAALQAASDEASQRRANMLEASSRRREFDTVKTIERNVMMRQQRLAADKRNTRKSKAK